MSRVPVVHDHAGWGATINAAPMQCSFGKMQQAVCQTMKHVEMARLEVAFLHAEIKLRGNCASFALFW